MIETLGSRSLSVPCPPWYDHPRSPQLSARSPRPPGRDPGVDQWSGLRCRLRCDVEVDSACGEFRRAAALPAQHRHDLLGEVAHLGLDLVAMEAAELEPGVEHEVVV